MGARDMANGEACHLNHPSQPCLLGALIPCAVTAVTRLLFTYPQSLKDKASVLFPLCVFVLAQALEFGKSSLK